MTAEIICIALAVYHEARNQPHLGQVAVAQVVTQRVHSRRFPNTACEVVYQDRQFSFYFDGKPDTPYNTEAWQESILVAVNVYVNGYRISALKDVTHYYAHYIDPPSWSYAMNVVAQIGDHIFLLEA